MKKNTIKELCIVDGFKLDIINKDGKTYLYGCRRMGSLRYERFSISLEKLNLKDLRNCLSSIYVNSGTKTFTAVGSIETSGVYIEGTRYIHSRRGKAEIMIHQCINQNVMIISVTDESTDKTMSLSISSSDWATPMMRLITKRALIEC